MPIQQRILAIVIGVLILFIIIELVKKRRLYEEFSWLWLIFGIGILIASLWSNLLLKLSRLFDVKIPALLIFSFGFIVLILITLYLSIKISELTEKVKDLVQQQSILELELKDFERKREI